MISNQIQCKQDYTKTYYNKLLRFKDKERILKAIEEKKQLTHERVLIKVAVNFLAETLQIRKEWDEIFKVPPNNLTTKNTFLGKAVFQK